MDPLTAYIFEESTGLFHYCDDALGYLDARGQGYQTKKEAKDAAREENYDAAIVGGRRYWL